MPIAPESAGVSQKKKKCFEVLFFYFYICFLSLKAVVCFMALEGWELEAAPSYAELSALNWVFSGGLGGLLLLQCQFRL